MLNKFAIEPANKETSKTIIDGINDYNLSQVAALSEIWTALDFIIKNNNGVEIGGILAGIGYWNGLEIKILWVKEDYRKTGIGTKLLKHVENLAIKKGATISMLDTFDFQAQEFYLKNGYEPIGEINNFPVGHKRIYLSKKLIK
ncbi:GNAT family N-acetyltransferase [Pedobacter jamesrossensis]|uniref:GNAT family N-acetyltransferase n=1 Tax=Pedobacter jamesrossensis TaxID=1908238 RepID=A0ABV8NPQ7_9SPHI